MAAAMYYVYILTNVSRKVLYVGVTHDLISRIQQHQTGSKPSFTSKYKCYNLIYYEEHQFIENAIAREKQLKGWTRAKKIALITENNPDLSFLTIQ